MEELIIFGVSVIDGAVTVSEIVVGVEKEDDVKVPGGMGVVREMTGEFTQADIIMGIRRDIIFKKFFILHLV